MGSKKIFNRDDEEQFAEQLAVGAPHIGRSEGYSAPASSASATQTDHQPSRDKQQLTVTNRLVGWLVSYADDAQGESFELRVGRTFVGRENAAGERTILIDDARDSSLSDLHAVLRATPQHELLVQDLFTAGGTTVQRRGASQGTTVSGAMKLEHGDWLQFGKSRRFQVVIIDAPPSVR